MKPQDDEQPGTRQRLTPRPNKNKATASSTPQGPRTVESSDLLAGQSSVLIEHMGEIYRLQTTRQGKLILTK